MEIIRRLLLNYEFLFDKLPDPRTKKWFLVAKPLHVIALLGLYLMFVLKWGPKWMKEQPPFHVNKIVMVYNALQVLTCAYVFLNGLKAAWARDYMWVCEPVDTSNAPKAIEIAKLVYLYFILKVVDLMDTIFFILRKKFKQVTFLHVYHHAGMVALVWGCVTYYPGGHGTLIGVINSFVHVVMYSYYFLTVTFPVKQSSWWKKYITQLQILQFILNIVHMTTVLFKPDCEYPRWISLFFLPQNIFMLVLFIDFYIKVYIRKPKAVIKPRIVTKGPNKISKLDVCKENEKDIFIESIKKRQNSFDLLKDNNNMLR